jgi:riboflavin kinase/FMN adenylyltransferase
MKVYKNFNINKSHRNSIILIGNFDGVHLGHRKLFNLAKNFSDKFKIKIGVLTFDPMPKIFLIKKSRTLKFQILNRKKSYYKNLEFNLL